MEKSPLEQSAQNDPTLKKCSFCYEGVVSEEIFNEQYGPMPSFCKNCPTGDEKYASYISTPKAQENLAQWKQARIQANFKKSGIGEHFKNASLQDLEGARKKTVENYVDHYPEYSKKGWGMYLWGDVGRGKTHIAMVVVKELLKRYCTDVLFVSIGEVSSRVRNSFNLQQSEDKNLFDDLKAIELLVIDDLGTENMTDWIKEQIYLLVNYRYEHGKPMIITSNQSLEDLKKLYLPQVSSRIMEACKVIKVSGGDLRENKKPTF